MSRVDDRSTIAEWVSEWFEQRGRSLQVTEILQNDADYIDTGIIDSIGMIEFIMDIESQFGIRLTSQTMKDPRFSTLRGLVEVIEEIINRRI